MLVFQREDFTPWRSLAPLLVSLVTKKPILGVLYLWGFPDSSAGKESACNAGNPGSIPVSGRFVEEGNDYPLQYFSLENSMDCILHGVAKSQTHFTFAPQTASLAPQHCCWQFCPTARLLLCSVLYLMQTVGIAPGPRFTRIKFPLSIKHVSVIDFGLSLWSWDLAGTRLAGWRMQPNGAVILSVIILLLLSKLQTLSYFK